jgi:phosphatidylserine/phosphatidylglycerophosphate/cardiolipin synthase-like enzyme
MSRTRKQTTGTIITVVIVLIFAIFYTISGADPLGFFSKNQGVNVTQSPAAATQGIVTATVSAGTPANSGGWWQVYFVTPRQITDTLAQSYSLNGLPPALMGGSITEKLIQHIDSAKKTIHIASFETDLNDVAKALIRAKGRGVDVDDENGIAADTKPGHGQFAMLKKAGIQVIDDGRGALMHDKFWLFDGQTVWTGSTNITVSGMFEQNNNVIVIDSPQLTAIYERQFNDMWAGKFNAKSPSTVDQQKITIQGSKIQILFSPEDKAVNNILPFIQSARKSIRFLAFTFTQDQLGKAMLDASKNGVQVSGVFESTGSDSQYSQMTPLYCAKIPVRQDGNPAFLHHKVIIVDEQIVITGSLNFTDNADQNNNENVIIVDNPDIARLYTEEFNRDWAVAHAPAPGKLVCK